MPVEDAIAALLRQDGEPVMADPPADGRREIGLVDQEPEDIGVRPEGQLPGRLKGPQGNNPRPKAGSPFQRRRRIRPRERALPAAVSPTCEFAPRSLRVLSRPRLHRIERPVSEAGIFTPPPPPSLGFSISDRVMGFQR
jgi:hypothetical protein